VSSARPRRARERARGREALGAVAVAVASVEARATVGGGQAHLAAGVGGADVALGQAVEREHDVVGPGLGQRRRRHRDLGVEEAVVVVERRDHLEPRHGGARRGQPVQLGDRAAARRRRGLREQRQRDDPVDAGGDQTLERAGQGRRAVAHPERHDPVVAQRRGHSVAQILAVVQERRAALGMPDRAIGVGALGRPGRQDDQVEQERPPDGVHVEDPGIAEELAQVTAHRRGGGRGRRPEVDEQEARGHDLV
jgi:hypothetical protein